MKCIADHLEQLMREANSNPSTLSSQMSYQSTFAGEGGRKAQFIVDDLTRTEPVVYRKTLTERMAVLSVGGGDASDLETIMRGAKIKHAILLEKSDEGCDAARVRKAELAREKVGSLTILQGDASDRLDDAIQKFRTLKDKGEIDGLVVLFLGVLHELPSRSISFDMRAFISQLTDITDETLFYISEPTSANNWPEIVNLKLSNLDSEQLCRWANYLRRALWSYNLPKDPVQLAAGFVKMHRDLAMECLFKGIRDDDAKRHLIEMGERLSSFDITLVAQAICQYSDEFQQSKMYHSTTGFHVALSEFGVVVRTESGVVLEPPDSHIRYVARCTRRPTMHVEVQPIDAARVISHSPFPELREAVWSTCFNDLRYLSDPTRNWERDLDREVKLQLLYCARRLALSDADLTDNQHLQTLVCRPSGLQVMFRNGRIIPTLRSNANSFFDVNKKKGHARANPEIYTRAERFTVWFDKFIAKSNIRVALWEGQTMASRFREQVRELARKGLLLPHERECLHSAIANATERSPDWGFGVLLKNLRLDNAYQHTIVHAIRACYMQNAIWSSGVPVAIPLDDVPAPQIDFAFKESGTLRRKITLSNKLRNLLPKRVLLIESLDEIDYQHLEDLQQEIEEIGYFTALKSLQDATSNSNSEAWESAVGNFSQVANSSIHLFLKYSLELVDLCGLTNGGLSIPLAAYRSSHGTRPMVWGVMPGWSVGGQLCWRSSGIAVLHPMMPEKPDSKF